MAHSKLLEDTLGYNGVCQKICLSAAGAENPLGEPGLSAGSPSLFCVQPLSNHNTECYTSALTARLSSAANK